MTIRDTVRIALFAAIIAALGLLPRIDVPIAAGVPITAQTLGVMLAGIMLGARQGALAVALFLFVVALGAPLLAGGRGGLGVFFGPTVGYLAGWFIGAAIGGWMMQVMRGLPIFLAAWLSAVIGGIVVVYLFGIPVLAWKANLSLAQAFWGGMVFVPGDIVKSLAAAAVSVAAYRSSPTLVAGRGPAP